MVKTDEALSCKDGVVIAHLVKFIPGPVPHLSPQGFEIQRSDP